MSKDLSLALSISKKNKSKKKNDQNAKSESRPEPGELNDSGKAPKDDSWTDQPTVAQAKKPSRVALSRPRMAGSDAFSVRDRDAADMEDKHKMSSEAPNNGPQRQPPSKMDEMGPDRKGPSTPSLKMKRMAEGGMLPMGSEDDNAEHPAGLESDNDQMRPPSKEYMSGLMQGMKHMMAEGGPVDQEMPSDDMMADGGMIDLDEVEEDKHSSIAAAIMAKKDREHAGSDSDDDEMQMMAEGGPIKSHGSMDSDDSDQADLSRNADEDANEEDQASFNALRKENYSESEGLEQLDSPMDSAQHGDESEDESENKHDMVSSIRRKMSMKRQFSKD